MRERPLSSVPRPALFLLALGLCLQLWWHHARPPRNVGTVRIPPVPSLRTLQLASLGEPVALSRLLMLQVQSFDSRPGGFVRYRDLDYAMLASWLERVIELDPRTQYPLFAATRVYGEVSDPERQRIMLDFAYRQFFGDPDHRWPALAHAAVLAKHRLKDLALARKYAQAIRLHATGANVPSWARQMEIFLLEDMNELESAKILLGGLLASGEITDPRELKFLESRLAELEAKMKRAP